MLNPWTGLFYIYRPCSLIGKGFSREVGHNWRQNVLPSLIWTDCCVLFWFFLFFLMFVFSKSLLEGLRDDRAGSAANQLLTLT